MLNNLGCLLDASGDLARGHALLLQAHRLRPDDPDIGYNYARSLFQQGKVDEAGKEADRLVTQTRILTKSVCSKQASLSRSKITPPHKTKSDKALKSSNKRSRTVESGTDWKAG